MSTTETIIWLGLAAVLAGYLYYRHWQRVRQNLEPTDSKDWIGKGFDPSGITPRIDRVRKDYLAGKPAPDSHFRRGLLAFARQAVSHLPFFQGRDHAGESGTGTQQR